MGDERADFEARTAELAGDVDDGLAFAAPSSSWAEAVDKRLVALDRRLAAAESTPAATAGELATLELERVRRRLALVARLLVEGDDVTLELVARLLSPAA